MEKCYRNIEAQSNSKSHGRHGRVTAVFILGTLKVENHEFKLTLCCKGDANESLTKQRIPFALLCYGSENKSCLHPGYLKMKRLQW